MGYEKKMGEVIESLDDDFGSGFGKPMPSVSNYLDFEMHELYGVDDQAYLMAQIDRYDGEDYNEAGCDSGLDPVCDAMEMSTSALKCLPYKEFLGTSYWAEVRRQKLEEANYQCASCGRTERLQVHHTTYDIIGEELENLEFLDVLCEDCHKRLHRIW